MLKKVISIVLLILLFVSLSYFRINIEPVKGWTGIVYIRPDGSVDPVTAPISIVGNFTYILTGDIIGSLIIERSGITVDGANHNVRRADDIAIKILGFSVTLRGFVINGSHTGISIQSYNNKIYNNTITKNYYGISISIGWGDTNNIIVGNIISGNVYGIRFERAENNKVYGNKIVGNTYGVYLYGRDDGCKNNEIAGNIITKNSHGIYLDGYYVYNNLIYHNNFIYNTNHLTFYTSVFPARSNSWDNGYPSGGNYWDNYNGVDADLDGIGDEPYMIYEFDHITQDRYPLITTFSTFYVGTWQAIDYYIDIISNSTISELFFNTNNKFISFNVTGENGTVGFCRVTIPKDLLWVIDGWKVLVNGQPINYTIIPDPVNTYLCFTYQHSTKQIKIQGTHAIPELPSTITLLPLLIFTALLAIVTKKRLLK